MCLLAFRARVEKDPAKVRVDRKGKKKARFLDMEVTVPTHVVNVSQSNLEGDLFNICQTIEQEFQSGDQIGLLSCGDCDYIMYDEALGNRELVPLRNILPHFRNGQPIPTRQRSVTPAFIFCYRLKEATLGEAFPSV